MDDFKKTSAEDAEVFDRKQQRQRKVPVLKTATTTFNRRDFANTSMDDVAAALGVSKPALLSILQEQARNPLRMPSSRDQARRGWR